jgi:hypothetical protein
MLILTAENQVINTDSMMVGEEVYNGTLNLQDPSNPDFFFNVIEFLDEFTAASVTLRIGDFEIVMPLHWSVLCTDMEYVHSIPLHELGGKQFSAFCLNPIDGFSPEFLQVRQGMIFPQANWTAPQMNDKDLLVVPLGDHKKPWQHDANHKKGPLCAMFSASKVEVYKSIGDIW